MYCAETRFLLESTITAAFLILILLSKISIRGPQWSWLRNLRGALSWPFRPFITTSEAYSSIYGLGGQELHELKAPIGLSGVLISFTALMQANAWMVTGAYQALYSIESTETFSLPLLACPFVVGVVWIYMFIRPLINPISTTPFDLLTLATVHIVFSTINLNSWLHAFLVINRGHVINWSAIPVLGCQALQLVVAIPILVICVVAYPLQAQPTSRAHKIPNITPEDSMTLWSCLTYGWMDSLIAHVCSFLVV